jgi:hypothetical protein
MPALSYQKTKLGFTNENLLAYGINPRRKPSRRRTATPETATKKDAAQDPAAPATTPTTAG